MRGGCRQAPPSSDKQAPFTDKCTPGGRLAVTSPFGLAVRPKGQRRLAGAMAVASPYLEGMRPAYMGAGTGPGYFSLVTTSLSTC